MTYPNGNPYDVNKLTAMVQLMTITSALVDDIEKNLPKYELEIIGNAFEMYQASAVVLTSIIGHRCRKMDNEECPEMPISLALYQRVSKQLQNDNKLADVFDNSCVVVDGLREDA